MKPEYIKCPYCKADVLWVEPPDIPVHLVSTYKDCACGAVMTVMLSWRLPQEYVKLNNKEEK